MMSLLGFAATARALPDIAPQIGDVSIDPGSTVDAGDVVEGCAGAQTGRTLLNFSIRTLSLGPDDLVMGNPGCPDCSTNPGAACTNPLYECSEAHGHPHFEGFARAELLDADDNVLVTGHKQGFACSTSTARSASRRSSTAATRASRPAAPTSTPLACRANTSTSPTYRSPTATIGCA
jgi:hypothetical protein